MSLRWIASGIALWVFSLWVTAQVVATQVPKMEMAELLSKTGLVFIGTTMSVDPNCPIQERPCTEVTFSDLEVLLGTSLEKEISFYLPQGMLNDGTYLRVEGAPTFYPGERYLVFIRSGDWHITPVTNWLHSVFREVRINGIKDYSFFVNYQGLAVVDIDKTGFVLGERITLPERFYQYEADPKRGQMGPAASSPPPISPKVQELIGAERMQLSDTDLENIGLTREQIILKIKDWDKNILRQMEEEIIISDKPAKNSLISNQVKDEARPIEDPLVIQELQERERESSIGEIYKTPGSAETR